MADRIFLDANVIMDFWLAREPAYPSTEKIFTHIAEEKILAFTSTGVHR